MKKILLSLCIILLTCMHNYAVDLYGSLGVDGHHNLGYEAGMIFQAKVYEPLKDDYMSYTHTWISSADTLATNNGKQFNITEILFRKLRENLYIGAGEGYTVIDNALYTKKDFSTIGAVLYYPRPEIKLLFQYERANDNDISGANLNACYVWKDQFTLEIWGGFFRSKYIPMGRSGYSFGTAIGFYLF